MSPLYLLEAGSASFFELKPQDLKIPRGHGRAGIPWDDLEGSGAAVSAPPYIKPIDIAIVSTEHIL